jgi:outer membrane protein assembly factor BamB
MSWLQFQANAASQGFTIASTGAARVAKWQIEIGSVGFASPVIGQNGAIYIGTLRGELVAVSPEGQVLWRKMLGQRESFIAGSPVIDSAGNIYAISTVRAIRRDHTGGSVVTTRTAHSTLYSVTSAGTIRWSYPLPKTTERGKTGGYCLSSPKISRGTEPFIFVPSIVSGVSPSSWAQVGLKIEMLVFGLDGVLHHRSKITEHGPGNVSTTGGIGSIPGAVWDFLNGMEFQPSGVPFPLHQIFGWPEPSIALVDFGKFRNAPIIVIDDNNWELGAYRFENQGFTNLWRKTSTSWRSAAAPAVFASQMVASGQKDGVLAFYDLLTGTSLWKPWYHAPYELRSPVASFLSQIYVVVRDKLVSLDANGKKVQEFTMGEEALGACVLSADRVFVSSGKGLHSLSLDLKEFVLHDLPGGLSSPVIADDGTVYVIDRNKTLHAFCN